jgi:RNA polymerase sigma-70 factor (ECF subfamily)
MATPGADLLRRLAAGDRTAFAPFYDQYASLVYPLVLRVVRDRADSADVLQAVFWEAWQSAGTYDPRRGSPEAWLLARARTYAVDRVRSVRRRSETVVGPVDDALAVAADRIADRDRIEAALSGLPAPQREALELAYWTGLTQTEIAERSKQPVGTVATRIRLGLERLREALIAR